MAGRPAHSGDFRRVPSSSSGACHCATALIKSRRLDWEVQTMTLKRRDFLKTSAAFAAASAAGGFSCTELASAAPVQAPEVARRSWRALVDGSYNLFLRPGAVKGVKVEPAPRRTDYRRALHNEWGLSLLVDSHKAAEQHTVLLDFGYTPEALLNNFD